MESKSNAFEPWRRTQVIAEIKTMVANNEESSRVLFQYATVGILVINEKGIIELINSFAEGIFGYSQDELLGQPVEALIPHDLRSKHTHHREHYFENPKARPMGLGIELHAVRKNGEIFPVEISLSYFTLDGELVAIAFITDITERKKAQNELKKMNDDLETRVERKTRELAASISREKQLNELKSRFVSMASHEFRSPLSVIHSSVSLIESYMSGGDPRITKHILRIKSSINNLTIILDDFLSLDKLEQQADVEIEWEEFDFRDFVSTLLDEMVSIQKKGQKFTRIHLGDSRVRSDRKKLRYILVNLLSNATKYSGEGSVINLTSTLSDNLLTITVEDHGIGIPEEEQELLFEKFFRAKNTATIQGTGLGLTIVKRYVERMGGQISFVSKENEGTTLTIQLPQSIDL